MNRKLFRYALAILIVSLAILIHLALTMVDGMVSPYLPVYLSVVFISVLLGRGPGIAAAALGVIGVEFIHVEPQFGIGFNAGLFIRGTVIVVSAAFLGYIGDRLRTSEGRLKAILNSIPDMAWLKDREGRLIVVNDPYAKSSGKDPAALTGKTDFDAWPADVAEKNRADDREVMRSGSYKRFEERMALPDGTARWVETIKTPIYNEAGRVVGTAGISRDVTERKLMEEEVRHMAQHDALTGLPNRRLFIDILSIELAQTRRHRNRLAVLFVDLDRFKEINDSLGHQIGDRLLQETASRFRAAIRETDTVARIGGDEFNIILSDISRPDDVPDIARKVVKSLRRPITVNGHELQVTASVGISIYPDDGKEVDALLRYADIAMYQAKESGRNMFRFYDSSVNKRSSERTKFESQLQQAIPRGELRVHYQPQIDLKTGKISKVEALVRWNHPERGLLEPGEFLPLAEETGFITSIDEWVLNTACEQARSWKDVGIDSFRVSINLSARQFQNAELVSMISDALRKAGMASHSLDIEVAENTAMSDLESSAPRLRELCEMGVHISIDHFGTGCSSFNYLKKAPIERIKIDKSFIRDIVTDKDNRAIIGAVTSMAHKMGIKTVAEGVETEEQLEFLRDSLCDEAQGFLFGRPVPAERFTEIMKKAA